MTERQRGALVTVVALLIGLACAGAAAALVRFTAATTLEMLGVAAGGAGLVGLLCLAALARMRAQALATQVTVAVITPIVVLAVGVLVGARAMFSSDHDLRALLVFVLAAGALGGVVAVGLGRRIQRLASERARADALERSRRELVAWVSHDLRTPLAGLRAVIEALEDGIVEDAESVERYQAAMRRNLERMTDLVEDLFELSRIQIGALELQLQLTGIDQPIEEALASFAELAASKGVQLSAHVSSPVPTVELSQRELVRALGNLLDNAIKHTPPGGTVHLEAHEELADGELIVSVFDGCGGIPPGDLERVFELAFRGDVARSQPGGGLGLAITQGLVAAHQGRVEVENTAQGCRFSICLPLHVRIASAR